MIRFAMRSFARSPARWFGGVSSAVILLAATVNVAFMQDGKHPAPLGGAEMPAPEQTASINPAPTPEPRAIPLPKAKYKPEPVAAPKRTNETDAIASLLSGNDAPAADTVADFQLLEVQTELQTLGYYSGDLDGLKGPQTKAAIEAFQKQQKLPLTGEVSEALLSRLQSSSVPAARPVTTSRIRLDDPEGDRTRQASLTESTASTAPSADPKVQALQRVLSELGYAPGPVDGLMGAGTRSAIEAFEADRGMVPTGTISPGLIRALEDFSGQTIG